MPRLGRPRDYGSKALSSKKATVALGQLLLNARPEKLREFTAEKLAAMWNVPVAKCGEMLERAREKRA